jgi:hypothetical protein
MGKINRSVRISNRITGACCKGMRLVSSRRREYIDLCIDCYWYLLVGTGRVIVIDECCIDCIVIDQCCID